MASQAVLKPDRVRPVPPAINSPDYQPPDKPAPQQTPRWRLACKAAIPWLFTVLLACVILQISLAGAGLLSDPEYLEAHRNFVHVFELLPIVILVVGLLGRDWLGASMGGALFLLIGIQYPLIEATGMARSLHVLNALLIFTVCVLLLRERVPWAVHKPNNA
ncbi:MAG TPA: DUF6220 domain-containing protein [Candidatus Thermoplasmatota archaeon]|nr:DUF6220 domain-containing protein [Candidatus Thermoplasmatota archaeon]